MVIEYAQHPCLAIFAVPMVSHIHQYFANLPDVEPSPSPSYNCQQPHSVESIKKEPIDVEME